MMAKARPSVGKPSPFRGRWLWATLVVTLLAVLFLRLGFWQLERLAQRRTANAQIVARMEQPALVLDGGPVDPDQIDLRRAVVRGIFDYDNEIVLRNRTYNELPGVHTITPLHIVGNETAILVDRGWIPYEMSSPEQRQAFQKPVSRVEVRGIIHRTQSRPSGLAPADPPLGPGQPRLDAWHRVDIHRIQEQIAYPLLPVFIEEEIDSTANSETGDKWRFPRPDPEIALSEGPHLVYSIQWFAFAGILVAGYGAFYRRRASR